MLVYNGDTDPAITSFAAQNWTSHLGLKELAEWSPWTLDGCKRVGGYVTRYEGGLDFLTIRGAGHLVPTYKPEAAFTFMTSWIEGKAYPKYDKDCIPKIKADVEMEVEDMAVKIMLRR
jgi:carboxypeptidase C (cathepsin A)